MEPTQRKTMGYVQVIENLAYHGIINLQQYLDNWDELDNIANICANTYNIPIQEVFADYESELEYRLVHLARE